ncbi:hypothetical protein [Botrimarina sp.]|uniref:hypothetical protein n=1 Tax=Botrimarina sp. TaxID=2795802 RepID=UPI0032EBCDAD
MAVVQHDRLENQIEEPLDTDADAPTQTRGNRLRQRLRILDVLGLSTGCCLYAGLQPLWLGEPPKEPFEAAYWLLYRVVSVAVFGTALGSATTLFRRAREGQQFQPGHWVLVALLLSMPLQLIGGLVYYLRTVGAPDYYATYYAWHAQRLVDCTLVGCCFLLIALLTLDQRWWSLLFWISGGVLVCLAPQHVAALNDVVSDWFWKSHQLAELVVGPVLLAVILTAALSDRRRAISRDWLHWLGVAVAVFYALANTVDGAYSVLNW